MTAAEFHNALACDDPPLGLPATLAALWWDAKGDWERAHALVDELETQDAMAVHAYLHRKHGDAENADYWYRRSYLHCYRPELDAEWDALVKELARSE